ncbi:MAG: 16S rRNA (guanine(527)-N(7))-methyltransferase RsmG [Clostridia bacterium]|nr:16S rRNA (guanine(527)-N(7))-methyltransferase RsmG [Clostridia bacterium]
MKQHLISCLESMGIAYTDAQIKQFVRYHELLAEWNEKINLTAIREPQEVAVKHFADCVYGIKHIPEGARVIDVGSGAGFPGVPLKIMRPDLTVLLLDSLNKRINFLNLLISELGLTNIQTLHSRAEDGAKDELREQFDVATARAVANLSVLSEYCLPYVKTGGIFLAYKGSAGHDELTEAKNAIATLGGKTETIEEYTLPDTDILHTLAIIRKVKPTNPKYPRNPGRIAKAPL